MANIHFHIEEVESKSILRVDVQASDAPCYVKDGNKEYFYLRTGPSTTELPVSKMYTYIKRRFYSQVDIGLH